MTAPTATPAAIRATDTKYRAARRAYQELDPFREYAGQPHEAMLLAWREHVATLNAWRAGRGA